MIVIIIIITHTTLKSTDKRRNYSHADGLDVVLTANQGLL